MRNSLPRETVCVIVLWLQLAQQSKCFCPVENGAVSSAAMLDVLCWQHVIKDRWVLTHVNVDWTKAILLLTFYCFAFIVFRLGTLHIALPPICI